MGTRNLTMVKRNGEYKVAQYGQWDGYPSGQGFNTVKFLTQPHFIYNSFIDKIDKLNHWTEKEIEEIDEKIESGQLKDWSVKHPELSRDLGSDIFDLIYKGKITKVNLRTDFASDGLWCEWGWCINIDNNSLDCFKGGKKPLSEDQPFYYLQKENSNDGYYPIELICSIPFDSLSKFETKHDFENYIYDVIEMGDKSIMNNGVPKNWEDNI